MDNPNHMILGVPSFSCTFTDNIDFEPNTKETQTPPLCPWISSEDESTGRFVRDYGAIDISNWGFRYVRRSVYMNGLSADTMRAIIHFMGPFHVLIGVKGSKHYRVVISQDGDLKINWVSIVSCGCGYFRAASSTLLKMQPFNSKFDTLYIAVMSNDLVRILYKYEIPLKNKYKYKCKGKSKQKNNIHNIVRILKNPEGFLTSHASDNDSVVLEMINAKLYDEINSVQPEQIKKDPLCLQRLSGSPSMGNNSGLLCDDINSSTFPEYGLVNLGNGQIIFDGPEGEAKNIFNLSINKEEVFLEKCVCDKVIISSTALAEYRVTPLYSDAEYSEENGTSPYVKYKSETTSTFNFFDKKAVQKILTYDFEDLACHCSFLHAALVHEMEPFFLREWISSDSRCLMEFKRDVEQEEELFESGERPPDFVLELDGSTASRMDKVYDMVASAGFDIEMNRSTSPRGDGEPQMVRQVSAELYRADRLDKQYGATSDERRLNCSTNTQTETEEMSDQAKAQSPTPIEGEVEIEIKKELSEESCPAGGDNCCDVGTETSSNEKEKQGEDADIGALTPTSPETGEMKCSPLEEGGDSIFQSPVRLHAAQFSQESNLIESPTESGMTADKYDDSSKMAAKNLEDKEETKPKRITLAAKKEYIKTIEKQLVSMRYELSKRMCRCRVDQRAPELMTRDVCWEHTRGENWAAFAGATSLEYVWRLKFFPLIISDTQKKYISNFCSDYSKDIDYSEMGTVTISKPIPTGIGFPGCLINDIKIGEGGIAALSLRAKAKSEMRLLVLVNLLNGSYAIIKDLICNYFFYILRNEIYVGVLNSNEMFHASLDKLFKHPCVSSFSHYIVPNIYDTDSTADNIAITEKIYYFTTNVDIVELNLRDGSYTYHTNSLHIIKFIPIISRSLGAALFAGISQHQMVNGTGPFNSLVVVGEDWKGYVYIYPTPKISYIILPDNSPSDVHRLAVVYSNGTIAADYVEFGLPDWFLGLYYSRLARIAGNVFLCCCDNGESIGCMTITLSTSAKK